MFLSVLFSLQVDNKMLVVSTLFGIVLIAFVIRFLCQKKLKHPPGPSGVPFFGNIFQLDRKHPHVTITKWSDYFGDVFKIKVRNVSGTHQ